MTSLSLSLIGRHQNPDAKSRVDRKSVYLSPLPDDSLSNASIVKGMGESKYISFELVSL